jgi:hypothetical protein
VPRTERLFFAWGWSRLRENQRLQWFDTSSPYGTAIALGRRFASPRGLLIVARGGGGWLTFGGAFGLTTPRLHAGLRPYVFGCAESTYDFGEGDNSGILGAGFGITGGNPVGLFAEGRYERFITTLPNHPGGSQNLFGFIVGVRIGGS